MVGIKHLDNTSYELTVQEHDNDEMDLVISILETYAHDIRKALKKGEIDNAKELLKSFCQSEYVLWFDPETIKYTKEELMKEIKEYEQTL